MIRSEIIEDFRVECPEITSRVITDEQLYNWCEKGDKLFCAETRCIIDQDGTTISTTEDDQYYDLTSEITKFYDIDDTYASGVLYNGKRLDKTSMSELDGESQNWRSRDAGTPKKWYRRGKYLYLDRPIDSNEYDLTVYSILISDDWNTDVAPYNQLTYLEPFHEAMVLYLIWKAKSKIGKPEEAVKAQSEFMAFVKWSKSQLLANKSSAIYFRKAI